MAEVEWIARTQHHDWSDRSVTAAMIDAVSEAGFIGRVEWVSGYEPDTRRAVQLEEPRPGVSLLAQLPKKEKRPYLEAGGETPRPWSLLLSVSPYLSKMGRVSGLSTLYFKFEGAPYEDREGSERLLHAFHRAHTPKNTEFAAIHPCKRWEQLLDTDYNPAVTVGPMLAGVFWANFLGRGHIEQFDRAQLEGLTAHEVTWVDDGQGLFLVTAPRLADATTPETEAEMRRLTALFRKARK